MRTIVLKTISDHGHARGRLSVEERLMRLTTHMTSAPLRAVPLTTTCNGRTLANRVLLFSVALVALAMVGFAGGARAANVDVYLQTQSYTKSLPGLVDPVPMWGFVCDPTALSNPNCIPQALGSPRIDVAAGDNLTINLTNTLPTPVSLVIPGQVESGVVAPVPFVDGQSRNRTRSFTHETAAGSISTPSSVVTYTWNGLRPGTYLYESGTHPSIQVPMGLYGALVVGPVTSVACTPPQEAAYDKLNSCHDAEALLLFSEIDPQQNSLVDAAAGVVASYPGTIDYNPTYFLINGVPYDTATPPAPVAAGASGDDVLLRLLNAGLRSHNPAIVGLDMGLIAEDGNTYPGLPLQQSAALLPAGKTLDVLVAMPAVDATYPLFDRMLDLSNNNQPDGGMLAYLQVGSGSAPPSPPSAPTEQSYPVTEDNSVSGPLVDGDGTLVDGPSNGTVSFGGGSFTYTPYADFSGSDSFTYRSSGGTLVIVTLDVSYDNDPPVATADGPYVNTIGPDITVDAAHGVLGNDMDPDGDTLTAVIDGTPPAGLTLHPDGSFEYTGGVPTSFSYVADDGTAQSAAVPVTLNINPVANIALTVQDPDGTVLTQYRWLVQEDATYHINPAAPPDPSETLSTGFHKSYMPVIAQSVSQDCGVETNTNVCDPEAIDPGHAFSELALDPEKYYYVSVLPNDAGTGMGHTIGGAQILPGQTAVTVVVNKQEIPTAQISVLVFEDISPTNGVPDPTEPGLGGYTITLEDAGGRYGQVGGTMSQDGFGNPLKNSLPCAPPATATGVILTCDDGTALIKDLPPGKYGVIAVAPAGSEGTWTQTSTIEGTKVQDTWVIANEPPFLVEFGAPGFHAFIGFVNPDDTTVPDGIPPGLRNNTVTGAVTMLHPERAPSQGDFDSGSYDVLAHTRAWVGLNSAAGNGPSYATVQADEDGSFTIEGIPDGTYQLAIWDTYLDQIISYQTVILSGGGITDVGNIPVPVWFGRHEHTVFLDSNENGMRDEGEEGLPEQAVNLRFRDGTVFQSYPTDTTGFVPFDQVFPFGSWQVAEVDYTRFKPTGVRIWVDGGGDVSGGPFPGLLNPQAGSPRIELGPTVLLEGFQSMPAMTSIFEWGKVPYSPGQNGGIAGIVFYGSTRGEMDPRLTVGDPWEPGIPGVKVRLYREMARDPAAVDVNVDPLDDFPGPGDTDHNGNGIFEGATAFALMQEVETDSWDDNPPTGCPGEITPNPFVDVTLNGDATRCFDGVRNFEQVRPAVFDGGYAFNDIPPGRYVVEVVPPTGYELIKEEDMNVGFGDAYGFSNSFAPVSVTLPNGMLVLVVPDQAMIEAAQGPEPGIAQPPCVGPYHIVPEELSLFPGETAPFAGAGRPLCNRKLVTLSDQGQAAADFHLFTSTPVVGQAQGLTTDDIAVETDPASPSFGDKWGPAFLPYAMRDFNGHEVYRGYSDAFGRYNSLLPSTFTANIPVPSGYSPAMHFVCLNDPGPLPGGGLDPKHNPNYGTFCYTLMYMPGTTTYLDTPLLPEAAFAAGFNSVDCAGTSGTPVVQQVDGTGVGPVVAAEGMLTITSQGMTEVPNPDYEGPLGTALPTVMRDYGFGSFGTNSRVTLNGVSLTGVSWSDGTITGNVPAGMTGDAQLVVTRENGMSSVNAVTVTIGELADATVSAGGSIQAAIDAANPGDLILVEPGMYDELVIMWKPVRLQGSGASTIINATKIPTQKLLDWRTQIKQLLNDGEFDLLPGQPGPDFDLVGAGLFGTELGAGITVLGKNGGPASYSSNPSRIDGLTIGGADGGGGIFVNGYAHNLEISNNKVTGNSGVLHGGIRIGHPFLPLTGDGPFGFNTGVNIHHNSITLNGGQSDNSSGGGLALNTGSDDYTVSGNYICGNFTLGEGAGIGHLGLSDNGLIEYNQVLFNQTFNQGLYRSGGGILIAGEPPVAGALTLGAGNVTIDANWIQGNHAATGHGGGIRTQSVNGRDVELNQAPPLASNWFHVLMTNNMIINNVAGWSGGGISLQDSVHADIFLNTIANNDSTATVGAVIDGGTNTSSRQPAGISVERNSLALDAVIPGFASSTLNFSNASLIRNILWRNRAFTYDGTMATPRLLPVLNQTSVGDCPSGADYFDLGVIDEGFSLNPLSSILTETTGYDDSNVSADPLFLSAYCNGTRSLNVPVGGTTMQVAQEAIEGGNFIDVRWGPLTPAWPPGNSPWDYHIASGSPAVDYEPSGPQTGVTHDIDNDPRAFQGYLKDLGADEVVGVPPPPPPPPVEGMVAYSSGDFGFIPVNTTAMLTITATVSNASVTFASSTDPAAPFAKTGDTCSGNTVAAGGTCTFAVTYSPTTAVVSNGSFMVTSDATGSPQSVSLSGTGVLQAPQGVVEITSATGGYSLGGGTLNFGNLSNGNYSSTVLLSVQETAEVTFGNLNLTGSNKFTKGADNCTGATVPPLGSCTVTINFNANGNGLKTGTLNLPHNGSGPQSLGLTGR